MIPDSPAELAGQALVVGFPGSDPPRELAALAERGQLGGWVLFSRNLGSVQEVAASCRRLRALCSHDRPPWIAVDQEGGRVQRLRAPPVLQLPPMRALGTLDDIALTRDAGRVLGAQLALLGFNLDFAPVLDVDTNPDNPVIGDRSFGRDPALCARHGVAFAQGLQTAGIAACGKHFPGHGDTHLDSHHALPSLPHDMQRLERVELLPFVAAARHVASIMTAHVRFDALDPTVPATLSRAVVTSLLRERLGFGGLIVSDDLEMRAVADLGPIGDTACAAIEAGCDVLLVCATPELALQAHAALTQRAEQDAAFRDRLRDACARSLQARTRLPQPQGPVESIEAALAQLVPPELTASLCTIASTS